MNAVLVNAVRGSGFALGLVLATACYGQAPTPAPLPTSGVIVEKPKTPLNPNSNSHRMEILSGPNVSVRYFGRDLAPTEMAALRDLEHAENTANNANAMAALRHLYMSNEMQMENRRHIVQMALYGFNTSSTFGAVSGGAVAAPFMGATGIPNNYSLVQNPYYPVSGLFPGQSATNPYFPNVYTPGFFGGDTGLSGTVTTAQSLHFGMGDEGPIKTEVAKAMAAGYTPESSAAALRGLDAAAARVASLPKLRDGAGGGGEGGKIALVDYPTLTVTTKDGKELKGKLVREDADWLYLQTDTEEVSIRKSDVNRTAKPLPK